MNYTIPMGTAVTSTPRSSRWDPMIYWKAYVGTALAIWAVIAFGFHYWNEIRDHWQMALVMIPGSLVAGSTPMGGGTVAFPILVLVLHQPPSNARNFAFIIQALGMTSALVFILGRKVKLPFRLLLGSTAGAAIGLMLGTFVVGPMVKDSMVKLLFSCLWMSFGLLILFGNAELRGLKSAGPPNTANTERVGLLVGLVGGLIAAMIGVGVEFCVFAVMVLIFRADLRIAVPAAVSAAALASVEGMLLHLLLGDIERRSVMDFLAAGPLVIFGAPIGAFLGSVLPRSRVLYFVSGLCVFQFCWTLKQTAHGSAAWIFTGVGMSLAVVLLFTLYRAGKRRENASGKGPVSEVGQAAVLQADA